MSKYEECCNLGLNIDKAMKCIEKLDYGSYSMDSLSQEQKDIFTIVSMLKAWQHDINKSISINENKYGAYLDIINTKEVLDILEQL
ncbi:hypothetical protein C1147_02465 [Clostridium botulinum]|uniref:hypothetical protein n=1 Tax=Clostridium botulinum TaxID=1491 RepID=UPI00016B9D07|nr:hypothetical protein [Clostridium botulinum]EDT83638.1 DNA polymerAse epsilon, catalytic subunit a [Clostridium botulinum Bf]NEZ88442.1 hypothetical protein [Clostridium botulinum]RFM21083.1 hypothetical protein C1147_02465 [Clostridium botulinum]WCJ75381.1 hypothetical protein MHB86_004026 [Clostridium botulinum]WCJ79220.1 hypothetical protein MHI66_004026 [Clostridium botulinum]